MNSTLLRTFVGLLAVLGLSACEPVDPTPFLGRWVYTSGEVIQNCRGDRSILDVEGELTIDVADIHSHADLLVFFNNCATEYSLPWSGNVAHLSHGQSCASMGTHVETSELIHHGDYLQHRERGQVHAYGVICTYELNAELERW